RDHPIGQPILPDRPPGAHHDAYHGTDHAADDHQPQADPDPAPQLVGDGLTGDRGAEVAADGPRNPVHVALWNRFVEAQLGGLRIAHGLWWTGAAFLQAVQ